MPVQKPKHECDLIEWHPQRNERCLHLNLAALLAALEPWCHCRARSPEAMPASIRGHLLAQPHWMQPGPPAHRAEGCTIQPISFAQDMAVLQPCWDRWNATGCSVLIAPVSGGVATPGSPQKDIMWWVLTESCCWSEAEESPQCKRLLLSALPVTLRWLSWIHMQIHSFGAWGRHRGNFKIQRFKSCFC